MRVLNPASSLPFAPWVGFHPHFNAQGTLPYPSDKVRRPSFGGPLNPDHSRRHHAGLVSYYALFQGMAASKPTSQLSLHDDILRYTQRPLRGLSCGSGFFPSRRWTLSLSDCLLGFAVQWYSEFGWGWYRLRQPAPIQSLYPHEPYRRLYLNRFRREPAISRLDWPFTPTHKSSERFSTHTGSGLHWVLPQLHPAHG